MHGCIIWRCKPCVGIRRFPVGFSVFGIEARRLTPQSPFSGKASPCGPRPLRLICNFRWTPSHEDRVTDTPYHVRAGTGLIISMKTRAPCSCSTRILYHPVRQRCHARPLCDLQKADLIFSVPSLCPSAAKSLYLSHKARLRRWHRAAQGSYIWEQATDTQNVPPPDPHPAATQANTAGLP